MSRKTRPEKRSGAKKQLTTNSVRNIVGRFDRRALIVGCSLIALLIATVAYARWSPKQPLESTSVKTDKPRSNERNPIKNVSTLSADELAAIPPEALHPHRPEPPGYNSSRGGLPPGALPPGVVLPGITETGRTMAQGYGVNDGLRQQFTGKERDTETGLDYFGARYYSSPQGRFTTPDELQSTSQKFILLGKGHPTKQALPNADLTNPQSLNKYHYALNNPLRYVDPDGQEPQDSFDNKINQLIRQQLKGEITEQQYRESLRGPAVGTAAALAIIIAVRGGAPIVGALFRWAAQNPDKVSLIAQGLQEGAGGPPGLTLGPTTGLRLAERSTGQRLGVQLGVELKESAHEGADYIVAGTKITIEAIGTPDAYKNWGRDNGAGFLKQLVRHVTEKTGVNYVAVDLQGASKSQVSAIKKVLNGLTEEQRKKIIYVK